MKDKLRSDGEIPHKKSLHCSLYRVFTLFKGTDVIGSLNMNKKKQVETMQQSIDYFKADKLVIAQEQSLQMDTILSHPLGPLPWALTTPDGLLRKTNKASLASLFQKNVQFFEEVPVNSAAVIDSMSLVQRLKEIN